MPRNTTASVTKRANNIIKKCKIKNLEERYQQLIRMNESEELLKAVRKCIQTALKNPEAHDKKRKIDSQKGAGRYRFHRLPEHQKNNPDFIENLINHDFLIEEKSKDYISAFKACAARHFKTSSIENLSTNQTKCPPLKLDPALKRTDRVESEKGVPTQLTQPKLGPVFTGDDGYKWQEVLPLSTTELSNTENEPNYMTSDIFIDDVPGIILDSQPHTPSVPITESDLSDWNRVIIETRPRTPVALPSPNTSDLPMSLTGQDFNYPLDPRNRGVRNFNKLLSSVWCALYTPPSQLPTTDDTKQVQSHFSLTHAKSES